MYGWFGHLGESWYFIFLYSVGDTDRGQKTKTEFEMFIPSVTISVDEKTL